MGIKKVRTVEDYTLAESLHRDKILGLCYTYDGPESCHIWLGNLYTNGYGNFSFTYKGTRYGFVATRLIYWLHNHKIPENVLDHLCKNPSCVNLKHLEDVTQHINVLRSNKVKSHCINGHEFTVENTRARREDGTGRICRICARETHQSRK